MDDSHLDYKQKFLKKKPLTGSCKMTCILYLGLSIAFNSIIIYNDSILGIIFFCDGPIKVTPCKKRESNKVQAIKYMELGLDVWTSTTSRETCRGIECFPKGTIKENYYFSFWLVIHL
jgi:hypothetical protein